MKLSSILFAVFGSAALSNDASASPGPLNIYRKAELAAKQQALLKSSIRSMDGDKEGAGYQTQWFEVPVDHYNGQDSRRFKMRYLVDDSKWGGEGYPVLFYTGNEGDIELFWANTQFVTNTLRDELKAAVVFAEHRYFGQTWPFGDSKTSFEPEGRGYLSVEQTMEDFAALLNAMRHKPINNSPAAHRVYGNSPVIAFGGSYGGMLSAWMRLKYPHLVEGALASSAPVLQYEGMTPPQAWNQLATNVFAKEGCSATVQMGLDFLESLRTAEEGDKAKADLQTASDAFKLCKPMEKPEDVGGLINWMLDSIGVLAMVNYPYPTSFLGAKPAWPVREFCKAAKEVVADGSPKAQAWERLRSAIEASGMLDKPSDCLDVSTSTSEQELGLDGWAYLSCTSQAMPIGSYGPPTDMLPSRPWNLSQISDGCQESWGTRPDVEWPWRFTGDATQWSACSNTILSSGRLDPWSTGSFHTAPSASCPVIWIEDGAHHLDLRLPNEQDPNSVIEARAQETAIIKQWIGDFRKRQGFNLQAAGTQSETGFLGVKPEVVVE